MFLKPIINLYYNKRTFLQPQFSVSLFQECILSFKNYDVRWNFDQHIFITHVLYILVNQIKMTETCLAINRYEKQASKEEAINVVAHYRISNISKTTISSNSKLKQNNHNHFYINFTQFRIMKNFLLSVHTWHTVFCGPTKIENFMNLI